MKFAKSYEPGAVEPEIYAAWEAAEVFKPIIDKMGGNITEEGVNAVLVPKNASGEVAGAYSIVMPPPNANGNLHIGHGLTIAIEDVLTRFHRLKGLSTWYVPGADHAGFETWVVYEKNLEKQGRSRFDYKREELYARVWDFVQEQRGNMELQVRALGASCDFSSLTFTLDKKVVLRAYETFERMWNEGMIYRGEKLVNYCPKHQTAFADIEVVHEEEKGYLWDIAYTYDGGEVVVSTTRPETLFGDVAVAVNPEDERYAGFEGKMVKLPLAGREIPIVFDEHADPEYGTGAVKITPAHDFDDFEVGKRHDLPKIQVIGKDGRMLPICGEEYAGLTTSECRKKVVKELEKQGLLRGKREISHAVAKCYKCGTVIEPTLMKQWFIDTKKLASLAIERVSAGEIKFYPENKGRVLTNYLEGLQDWNISRQIPWGIAIPMYRRKRQTEANSASVDALLTRSTSSTARSVAPTSLNLHSADASSGDGDSVALVSLNSHSADASEEMDRSATPVSLNSHSAAASLEVNHSATSASLHMEPADGSLNGDEAPEWVFDRRAGFADGTGEDSEYGSGLTEIEIDGVIYERDEDTFDTWFSSAHWPIVCTDWKEGEKNPFYPLDVMETGADILFAWVARMIMMGVYVTGEVPFREVYLHGLVLDEKGLKMSKSKGNVINPMELVGKYGSDAFRIGILKGRSAGMNQAFSENSVVMGRNLCNKLWNISRFVQGLVEENVENAVELTAAKELLQNGYETKNMGEDWIVREIGAVANEVTKLLDEYRFAEAVDALYELIWNKYADWFLESQKIYKNIPLLKRSLEMILVMLHPFAPFVTEAIWQNLSWTNGMIAVEKWPSGVKFDPISAEKFETLMVAVVEVRRALNELSGALNGKKCGLLFGNSSLIDDNSLLVQFLTKVSSVMSHEGVPRGMRLPVANMELYLDVSPEVVASYKAGLEERILAVGREIDTLNARLMNPRYVDKAPMELVNETRKQLAEKEEMVTKLREEMVAIE